MATRNQMSVLCKISNATYLHNKNRSVCGKKHSDEFFTLMASSMKQANHFTAVAGYWVLSRIMHKFICRPRLNEVSQQQRRRAKPSLSASCSCISYCPAEFPLHGADSHRPTSEQSSHPGTSLPHASYGKSCGSTIQLYCCCGCMSNARLGSPVGQCFQCRPPLS